MDKLRLCFIGPARAVQLQRWVEWFATRGHATTVITVEPADRPATPAFQQIDVGTSWPSRKTGRMLSTIQMALAVRRLKPDLVHAHYLRGLAWGLPLVRGVPFIVTPWGSDVLEEQGAFREPYSRALTRSVFRRADVVHVQSAYMEGRVRPFVPSGTPVIRVGWGVNLDRFRPGLDVRPLRRQWGIGDDRRVIFSPRLTQPFYNHDLVIRALPAVRHRVPEALLIVGGALADADYVVRLRALASELGVKDHVRFLDAISYAEMPGWYNMADAVVMVPRSDGMPSTLLETMACGAVPVLSRLPQYDELIRDRDNGFLVELEPDALAGALVDALAAGVRPSMAERNRRLVTDVADQDKEMARMQQHYLELAHAGRARS